MNTSNQSKAITGGAYMCSQFLYTIFVFTAIIYSVYQSCVQIGPDTRLVTKTRQSLIVNFKFQACCKTLISSHQMIATKYGCMNIAADKEQN